MQPYHCFIRACVNPAVADIRTAESRAADHAAQSCVHEFCSKIQGADDEGRFRRRCQNRFRGKYTMSMKLCWRAWRDGVGTLIFFSTKARKNRRPSGANSGSKRCLRTCTENSQLNSASTVNYRTEHAPKSRGAAIDCMRR